MEAITLSDIPEDELPTPLLALLPRERAYVLGILEHGDRTKAAAEAGYANPRVEGWRLARRPRVTQALGELREAIADHAIAKPREVLAHLTEIVRGTHQGAKSNDVVSASNILLKAQGAIGPEAMIDARKQTVIQIGADAPIELLDALDILRRIADGETVDPSEAGDVLAGLRELPHTGA